MTQLTATGCLTGKTVAAAAAACPIGNVDVLARETVAQTLLRCLGIHVTGQTGLAVRGIET